MTRGVAAATFMLCAALTLTACEDEAVTVSGGGSAGSGGETLTLTGAGVEIPADRAEKALIDESALPKGARYVARPVTRSNGAATLGATATRTDPPVDPAGCESWWAQWRALDTRRAVGAGRDFDVDGDVTKGGFSYMVRSYADPADATRRVEHLAKAPQACKTFTDHQKLDGRAYDVRYEVSPLTFSRPGDRSAAIKLRREYVHPLDGGRVVRYAQIALVQVGHNEIFLQSTTLEPVSDADLGTLLNDGFRRLEEATR